MRKIIGIMLAVSLIFTSVSAFSFAEPNEPIPVTEAPVNYGIYIGGVQITSDNASDVTGSGISGKVSYDAETATITLNNATITGEYKYSKYPECKSSLYAKSDIEINLIGTNVIEKGIYDPSYEIDIVGSGSLTVNPADCNTGSIEVVKCGDFYVGEKASVTINGVVNTTCRALIAQNLAVEGYLKLYSPSQQNSFGFEASDPSKSCTVCITKTGTLNIYASASSTTQWAEGIQTYQGEVINEGKLVITAKGGKYSDGIGCDKLTLLDGSSTQISATRYAVDGETIKYGDKISCKAGSSSSKAYAAKVSAGFAEKYFKAADKLSGSVCPTTLKSLSKSKSTMTVKWNTKPSYFVSGYQIQYSTSSKFKSGNKTVTVKGASSKSKVIKSLKKKKYYVRVRTYSKVLGKTKYSSWSKAKSITIK